MRALSSLFQKILPASLKTSVGVSLIKRDYGQFRLTLFSVMIFIAVIPVFTVAGIGYYKYKKLLQTEESGQLEWQLDGSNKSIQAMVEGLESVVKFAARRDRYIELISHQNLDNLFVRLEHQYPFFADIGVINYLGIQKAYVGPYGLFGKDYSHEIWFQEVIDKGVYISEIYTGYREIPHFAIAVSNMDPNTNQVWVLRTTIDASTLQQFINTIKTNAADDLFLIDNKSVLQTRSEYYGEPLTNIDISTAVGIEHSLNSEGESIFHAVGQIKNTPWFLVLVNKKYIHEEEWISFRGRLFLSVIICILTSLFIVDILVTMVTNLVKESDKKQLTFLKEAEHTDKLAAIGRLAAGVGHEINNPLAIINENNGLIEDLLQMSPEFEHKKEMYQSISKVAQSVERCKAITHRLLGFAKRRDIVSEHLQINDILEEVLVFLENSMTYNRIKINMELQDTIPSVKSDPLQLQQIFLNIINNAMNAIGKDGAITVFTHMVAGDIRVVIQDDGPGIEESTLPHIFEPFYTTNPEGTGLGLSITYGLIKQLGGEISVRSHIGKGTAFTLTIPT